MKNIILIPFLVAFIFASVADQTVVIYSQGWAQIQEIRNLELKSKGEVEFSLTGLPRETDQGSIRLIIPGMKLNRREFRYRPLNQISMLREQVGKELDLVRYGEDGAISFRTKGKLLQMIDQPVYQIDGNVVFNPPYEVLFTDLPEGATTGGAELVCAGNSKEREISAFLTYLTRNYSWTCDYTLTMKEMDHCMLEGWFRISNGNNVALDPSQITLVTGDVNFNGSYQPVSPRAVGRSEMTKDFSAMAVMAAPDPFSVSGTDDFAIFTITEPSVLPAQGSQQFPYISIENLRVSKIYKIQHQLNYGGHNRSHEPQPVDVEYRFSADDIGEYNHPAGVVRVYEQAPAGEIYVGSGQTDIVSAGEKFKIRTGRSHDVTAHIIQKGYEQERKHYVHEIEAEVVNKQPHQVILEWREMISGDWDIKLNSHPFTRENAQTALFKLKIPAQQSVTVKFTAELRRQ